MKSSLIITMMILLVAGLLGHMAEPTPSSALAEATIRVPEDYGTIQAAIDAAGDGDLVLVGPGTYNENLTIDGKSIILASHYHITADDTIIDQTIIDGGGSNTITVKASAGPQTRVPLSEVLLPSLLNCLHAITFLKVLWKYLFCHVDYL